MPLEDRAAALAAMPPAARVATLGAMSPQQRAATKEFMANPTSEPGVIGRKYINATCFKMHMLHGDGCDMMCTFTIIHATATGHKDAQIQTTSPQKKERRRRRPNILTNKDLNVQAAVPIVKVDRN